MTRTLAWLPALLAPLLLSAGARADYLLQTTVTPKAIASGHSHLTFTVHPSPVSLGAANNISLVIANLHLFSTNRTGIDTFNKPVSVDLHFTDRAHPGSTADASFQGLVTGTLANRSGNLTTTSPPLTLTFAETTRNIRLGQKAFIISVPASTQAASGALTAIIGPAASPQQTPEPSGLFLAACACLALARHCRPSRRLARSGAVGASGYASVSP